MSVHRFDTTTTLPITRDEAWAFFSDPRNLAKITPPAMGFVIKSDVPEHVYTGLMITYTVRPMFNVPVTWVTEITSVVEGVRFVDEQRAGPYAMWHHEHHFREVPGGTEMRDIIHYAVPGGPFGDIVNHYVVARRVAEIFAHRRRVLDAQFGTMDAAGLRAIAG
ncbi:MAG: SRPBCC family protein [Chloroflexota bacterium]